MQINNLQQLNQKISEDAFREEAAKWREAEEQYDLATKSYREAQEYYNQALEIIRELREIEDDNG